MKINKYKMEKLSECCGATELYNSGLCSECKEHTEFEYTD